MNGLLNRALGKPEGSAAVEKIDIPFDLNKIFTLTYGFEPLKEVIEYLFAQLKKGENETHKLDIKLTTRMMTLDQYNFHS